MVNLNLLIIIIASENNNYNTNNTGDIINNSSNTDLKYAITGVASVNAILVLIIVISFTVCLVLSCQKRKKQKNERVCINNEQEMARVNHRGYNILNRQDAGLQAIGKITNLQEAMRV